MDELNTRDSVRAKDSMAASHPVSASNPDSIQKMFGSISKKYDLANSVLSAGIHHLWKKRLIRESGLQKGDRVLDCATGTGDLAFLFEKALGGSGTVLGTDFCAPMLEVAKEKAQSRGSSCTFEWADVTKLSYPNDHF